jgi:MoaA/NifB/PqqE/SkfB family radical SAM enzyme
MPESITKRIDAVTHIESKYLSADPIPAPKSVKIELSPRCNYKCGFCSLRERKEAPKPRDDMDIDLFKKIVTEAMEAGVEEIGLFYLGESTINPILLIEALEFCKQEAKVPYVFLTSNGSLATPALVEDLMREGLDSLKWSVNACDEKQFAEIMCVSPRWFHRALENIRAAHAIRARGGYTTRLYASSILYDGEQRDRMEEFLIENIRPWVDEQYYLPLYGMGQTADKIKDRIGYFPTHGNSGRIDPSTGLPNRDPLPCWSVFSEGHVRADGGMSACCFGSTDRFDVGDLTSQSFMEAWNSPAIRGIRAAQLRTQAEGPAALTGTMCEVCCAYG